MKATRWLGAAAAAAALAGAGAARAQGYFGSPVIPNGFFAAPAAGPGIRPLGALGTLAGGWGSSALLRDRILAAQLSGPNFSAGFPAPPVVAQPNLGGAGQSGAAAGQSEGTREAGANGSGREANAGGATGGGVVLFDRFGNPVLATPVGAVAVPGAILPRTSETVEARIEKDGRLFIRWNGDPRTVRGITFALLDSRRNTIKATVINRLPTETRFKLTNRTAYYQVRVDYLNGTTTTVVSPL